MRRLFILRLFKVSVLHLVLSSAALLFANIQLENNSEELVNIESRKSKQEFEEFKRQREQRFRELRDRDINKRRAVIQKQSLPNNEKSERYFLEMNKINKDVNLKELSMGMSSDYLEAIKNNATFVRVGSKIFGNRG